jgi:iron complex outermembrane receptor protein
MKHRALPRLSLLAQALLLLGGAAQAQTQPAAAPQQLERIEITGSSIKRIDAETALPVQVLKREDIAKTGASTAAELMKAISANTAGLTDGQSISDNTGGQRGLNAANLRGIGVSGTLVLLNGRRMANFATPGDDAGVDLNNIPSGAIDRVEILKDGASAIYGTDAIGGVINFITRKDFRGVDLYAYAFGTQEGGAGKQTVTLSAGTGSLAQEGYNVLAVLDLQKLGGLRSSQRDFIQQRPLASTLPFYLSTRPLPGNIRLQGSSGSRRNQLAAINAAGLNFDGAPITERAFNLFGKSGCLGPASVYAPDNLSQACSYDYMLDTEVYPESQRASALVRGVAKLGGGWEGFGEALLAQAESTYVSSPNPVEVTDISVGTLNAWLPAGKKLPSTLLSGAAMPDLSLRFRMSDAGNRTNEVLSQATRFVLGARGQLGGWDAETALVRAENQVEDRIVSGYFLYNEFLAAVRGGRINPFAPNDAGGLAVIDGIKVADTTRNSKGTTTSWDFKLSSELAELDGGALTLAFGGEARIESQQFTPSALLRTNNIYGDRSGRGDLPEASDRDRTVAGVFTEVIAPLSKQLELSAALRYDRYQGVGDTWNPKVGLRFQPMREMVLRASAGTGFRAPSFTDLYAPSSRGSSPAMLTDPGCVALGDSPVDCTDQFRIDRQSNPNLKPEKSTQMSAGIVFEPTRSISLSVDYWRITMKDLISTLGEQIILENLDKYDLPNTFDDDTLTCGTPVGDFVCRDNDGYIDTLLLRKENQGQLKTSGIDIEAKYRHDAGELGRFTFGLSGTWVAQYKRQFGGKDGFENNAGRFLQDQAVQRWRHRAAIDWDLGAFGLTLANTTSSSYADHNIAINLNGDRLADNRVKAYSLWDLTGSWQVSKALRLRAGVQNLADTAPPFSNQAYYFLSTYDPGSTDPRGRSFYLSANYKF